MNSVSLITASYNSEGTIIDTLNSVAFQDYPDIEHIVVDGASLDSTLDIVEANGSRLAKVVSERDKGIYDAYNKGLKLASGAIIGFINSDDFYRSPSVISEVVDSFRDQSIDAVYADLVYVEKNNVNQITRHWRSRPFTTDSLKQGFLPAHPTLFLRRTVYERAGGFDTSYRLAADAEFMIRILKTYRVRSCYVPRVWVGMRNGGATGGSFSSLWKQNNEIRRALKQHGVEAPFISFYVHKIIDRSLQRIRARSIGPAPEVRSA